MTVPSIVLPPYFSSGIVIQQHVPLQLKGTAPPGSSLALELYCEAPPEGVPVIVEKKIGLVHTDRCDVDADGNFALFIPSLGASFHRYTLHIYFITQPDSEEEKTSEETDEADQSKDAEKTKKKKTLVKPSERLIVENILVGEVWVTGGQGNMEMPLYAVNEGRDIPLFQKADYVRFFVQDAFGIDPTKGAFSYRPKRRFANAFWVTSNDDQNLRHISGLAAYIGIELENALQVPIGIIDTALAESMVHTWIDRGTIQSDRKYVQQLQERGLWVDKKTWAPRSRRSIRQPSVFFNHKIAPFEGMSVRGFIFAQGENEVGDEYFFQRGFLLQIESWQKVFKPVPGEKLRVVYTGLSPCSYYEESASALPRFNLMLARLRKAVPVPAGFVAVQDLDPSWVTSPPQWRNPRYPVYKRELAIRIATIILGMAYRRKLPVTSPEISRVKRVGNKLMLSLRHLEQNLKLRSGDTSLKGFAICGEDNVYRPAYATILYGIEVMVWHPDIAIPKQITYAYREMALEANLQTGENLTIAPFSTSNDPGEPAAENEWTYCDQLFTWATTKGIQVQNKTNLDSKTNHVRPATSAVHTPKDKIRKPKMDLSSDMLYPGGVLPTEFISQWRDLEEVDVRLKLNTQTFYSGGNSLAVSYAGSEADMPILSPELDAFSMRPHLYLKNYHSLQIMVFNMDGRVKELRLEGSSQWHRLEASVEWQTFIFDLKPLHEQNINHIVLRIMDKMRVGLILIDHFELKRNLFEPFKIEGEDFRYGSNELYDEELERSSIQSTQSKSTDGTKAKSESDEKDIGIRKPDLNASPPPQIRRVTLDKLDLNDFAGVNADGKAPTEMELDKAKNIDKSETEKNGGSSELDQTVESDETDAKE
ncbi:MAG: hypothetical protein ACOYCB_07210 [Fastidiosipilaceae bacterium]|jgi:sialate O-acetylesterase